MSVAPNMHPGGGEASSGLASAIEKGLGASARAASTPRFAKSVMAAIILWEAVILYIKAGKVPLWYDELLTLYVSALHPFSILLRALQTGVDGMPAGYYAVIQIARTLPIDPHIAVRLPSIIGYIATLLAIFWFTNRRMPPLTALTAALLLTLNPFREYATEARSYSLLVGSLAVSAVLWQRIGERRFITPLFGLVLAFAVSLHHLAVVAISSFGIAELTFIVFSRRIRWWVWAAMVSASCPFFLGLPTLLHLRAIFGRNFGHSRIGGQSDRHIKPTSGLTRSLLLL